MKQKAWRRKVWAVILEACQKTRPNLRWALSPVAGHPDLACLEVGDGTVTTTLNINLRTVVKQGRRRDFGHLSETFESLLAAYYLIHEEKAS